MAGSSVLYYIQTDFLCIVFLMIVAFLSHNDRGAVPALRVKFTRIVLVTGIMCISDIFAWLCDGQSFEGTRFLLELFNMVYDASITLVCFLWLNYVMLKVKGLESYSRENRLKSAIPMLIMMALLVTNPLTGFVYTIDENNVYARGDGIFLHWIISWGYLVWATVLVLKQRRKCQSVTQRQQISPLLWFVVPPAISAACQMIVYGLTAITCGITVSIVIIAFFNLREKVSKDSLTNLNNRNSFEGYIDAGISRQDAEFTLIMCDVDKFKTINDTMGHIVGDLVLKRVADILKEACGASRDPMFLCRYGGDEFVICGTKITEEGLEDLRAAVARGLSVFNREYDGRIKLGLSLGIAKGHCADYKDVETLIHTADSSMYKEKRSK